MRTRKALVALVAASAGVCIIACENPATSVSVPVTVPREMVSIRPGPDFPATRDNNTEIHIGELKEIDGQKLYDTVGGGRLCIGGAAGCGLEGFYVLPSPVTLKLNVDYVIVLRSVTRRFSAHIDTGDEFFVFGQRVVRSVFTKSVQEWMSDGIYPAGVFRIVDRRRTIQ